MRDDTRPRPSLRGWLLVAPVLVSGLVAVWSLGAGTLLRSMVVVGLLAVPLALSVAALLDIAHRPRWVWALAGRSQVLWLALVLVGILLLVPGLLVSLLYLLTVRPELRRIEGGELSGWAD